MDGDHIAERVESHRPYLELLARINISKHLQAKLDPSDMVQLTIIQACESDFDGNDRAVRAWLRTILAHTIARQARRFSIEKRDIRRERSLELALEASSTWIEGWLRDHASSPSNKAVRGELLVRFASALASLPDGQRDVVTMRYCQGMSIEKICEHSGRTPGSVAGLLKRGLMQLRAQFKE